MTASKKNRPLAEAFTIYLREHGKRVTTERMAVIEAVDRHTDVFTVDDLYREINGENTYVSLATVYNTIALLCEASLVSAVSVPDTPNVIYKVSGVSSVQILRVCDKCGKIRETAERSIISALAGHSFRGFATRAITLTVNGLCPQCSRRRKKK